MKNLDGYFEICFTKYFEIYFTKTWRREMYSIPFCGAHRPHKECLTIRSRDEHKAKLFFFRSKVKNYQSLSFAGVVERASKELSRRFTSFAARTRRGSKHEKLEDITEHKHKEDNSEQVCNPLQISSIENSFKATMTNFSNSPLDPINLGNDQNDNTLFQNSNTCE